jgi:hypothetical protein
MGKMVGRITFCELHKIMLLLHKGQLTHSLFKAHQRHNCRLCALIDTGVWLLFLHVLTCHPPISTPDSDFPLIKSLLSQKSASFRSKSQNSLALGKKSCKKCHASSALGSFSFSLIRQFVNAHTERAAAG